MADPVDVDDKDYSFHKRRRQKEVTSLTPPSPLGIKTIIKNLAKDQK